MSRLSDSSTARIPVATSLDTEVSLLPTGERPVSRRLLYLSIQAVINALIIGVIAKLLVELINLITNISFYGSFSLEERGPAEHQLGMWVILVPVIGALIIGVMARLGTTAIRGHGIPEAMEQVLTNESRIKPIITLLKPLSAAISIGTGGPFGAEGPIISTGGALGSFAGQLMRISAHERKIMLTAGATAGMATIFGTPLAAVLLAIELLLFEFSPRTIIPVALSCTTGAAMHFLLFSTAPVFAMPAIPAADYQALVWYVGMGIIIGILAALVSKSIYIIEDWFEKLPVHWMWWPAIGGLAVGITGYFAPYTMGVGYNNITGLLTGQLPLQLVLGLCFLKFLSWSISLGSGTSGGTLAPLLTIGGAAGTGLGMLLQYLDPHTTINLPTCALIGMAAMFAGAARALLTSIVFALEVTMQPHGLLPLLGACTASYFISFFLMKGSIMTEKIQRRGVTTPDAYQPDLLQQLPVVTAMDTRFSVIAANESAATAKNRLHQGAPALVITDKDGKPAGVLTAATLFPADDHAPLQTLLPAARPYLYPDSTMGFAIALMARYGVECLPVVTREQPDTVTGILTPALIFAAYNKQRQAEYQHERTISWKHRKNRWLVKNRQRRI